MFKLLSTAAALALASVAIAQTTQPGQTTPSVTPSDTPAVTPSQSPAATPSETPAAAPSQSPSATPYSRPPMLGESAVGGMSKCENMIGSDKDKCLQEERAASTGGRAAGAGGSHAPGGTGTGAGTMGSQPTAPAGTIR